MCIRDSFKEGGKLYIPIDVTPKTGSYYAREEKLRFERPADFLMILDGKENSRVLVQDLSLIHIFS